MKKNPGIIKLKSTDWLPYGTVQGKKYARNVAKILKKKYGAEAVKIETEGEMHHDIYIKWR